MDIRPATCMLCPGGAGMIAISETQLPSEGAIHNMLSAGVERADPEYWQRLFAARTPEAVWALHRQQMAGFGFDRLLYAMARGRTHDGFVDARDTLLLSNHDPAYLAVYLDEGLFRNLPVLNWVLANVGACSWRYNSQQIAAGAAPRDAARTLEFNRLHGVTAGYTISFPRRSRLEVAAIALCAAPGIGQDEVDALWRARGAEIEALNIAAHLKIASLPCPATRRLLSARQREVLEWVAAGKTLGEIARILALTPATIEKHLRQARQILDVGTTAQAVLKAAAQTQIYAFNPPAEAAHPTPATTTPSLGA